MEKQSIDIGKFLEDLKNSTTSGMRSLVELAKDKVNLHDPGQRFLLGGIVGGGLGAGGTALKELLTPASDDDEDDPGRLSRRVRRNAVLAGLLSGFGGYFAPELYEGASNIKELLGKK